MKECIICRKQFSTLNSFKEHKCNKTRNTRTMTLKEMLQNKRTLTNKQKDKLIDELEDYYYEYLETE